MTMPTPSASDLLRFLDPGSVAHLLEAAARISGKASAELLDLYDELRRIQDRRTVHAGQLQLDLSKASPSMVTPCMSPPRAAITDYVAWLRAGGGRPVNAPCGIHCPCGGTSPSALDTFPWPITR